MSRRTPVAAVLTLVVGASFAAATAVGPGASASPARPVAARTSLATREAAAGAGPSWLQTHGRHPSAVPRATTTSVHPEATQHAAANGTVSVTVSGREATVASRVRALGGRVLAGTPTSSVAVIPQRSAGTLAKAAGISAVGAVNHPYAEAAPAMGASQAVAASNADDWQDAGTTGAGVKLAIVDLGFGSTQQQYTTEVNKGHLGASPHVDAGDCVDSNHTTDAYDDEHGLAVAEIAHQQAPDTQLYLYCVNSPQGLSDAVDKIDAAGITIASSSLGWFEDARGDGTGDADSVATSVKRARQEGILWINSAGNEVPQHISGTQADADRDGYLDIGNHSEDVFPFESNFYTVAPGTEDDPSDFAWFYQWDNWPTTNSRVSLEAYGVQCTADDGSGGEDDCQGVDLTPITTTTSAGDTPTASIDLAEDGSPNTSEFPQVWEIAVRFIGSFTPGARWDLFGEGDAEYASTLSCPTQNADGTCKFSSAAANGSVVSPANSPYALAVGATDVGADGETPGTLEYFSSQGPTIDGRIKPDISGWDGLSSYIYAGGFYGTSAAAPAVAGAAALVKSANPSLDAAQIQNFLEQRASHLVGTSIKSGAYNPPSYQFGHGLLTLGATPAATPVTAPTGSQYTSQAPVRLLDTRPGQLPAGHKGALVAGGTVTIPVNVPAGTTAVAINLTGTNATATTFLTAYPGGTAAPRASNLNLSRVSPTAAVFAVVKVGANNMITIRNDLGSTNVVVDQLGYFSTNGTEKGLYNALSQPTRVLDTRVDGETVKPGVSNAVTVDPGLQEQGASAAIVNVTVTHSSGAGSINASATCSAGSSTVNLAVRTTRANLAVVQLDGDGKFCITDSSNATDVVVDVLGYMGAQGSQYYPLPSTTRIVDTRVGLGGSAGGARFKALAANTSTAFYGGNVGDVPSSATALLTGVVEASATAAGYLEVFPGATAPASPTSNLNVVPGRAIPNAVIVGLPTSGSDAHEFGIYNQVGNTQAAVDVFGYFAPPPAQ